VAYDVVVRVGIARFLECRQFEEIQLEMSHRHGLEIPVRTLSYQAQRFLAHLQAVHEESIPLLRAAMSERGGYILHIDGTCEEASRVLLVCLDSLSEQVLDSRKIVSESTEQVASVLHRVRRDWGEPLAIVLDLRASNIAAAKEVFPNVPLFVCHYHLAADVGKDILGAHTDRLRELFRQTKMRPALRALCRSLREFAVREGTTEHVVESVLACKSKHQLEGLATPETTKGTVHALASWILAFSNSGDGYGFPFDLPYLNLYERVRAAHQMLEEIEARIPVNTPSALAIVRRFKKVLDLVLASEYSEDIRVTVAETKKDFSIFQRFRTALRICPVGGKHRRNDEGCARDLSPRRHQMILSDLATSLTRRARNRDSSQKACEIVLEHLDKYWDFIFGHALKVPVSITVPRTNNVEERLFRAVKRQCRRIHGRGHLSRDLDDMPSSTPLVLNLKNTRYCQTVYGGSEPERIAERFSAVPPRAVANITQAWKQEKVSMRIPRKLERLPDLPRRLAPFLALASRELRK